MRIESAKADGPDPSYLLSWELEVAPASRACLRGQMGMYKDYLLYLSISHWHYKII